MDDVRKQEVRALLAATAGVFTDGAAMALVLRLAR
jgi:hypothetical protein